MRVRLRFFAALRDEMGRAAVRTVASGTTVGALWRSLVAEHPALGRSPVSFVVNEEYVGATHELAADDEVAFLPPVSGGSSRCSR